MKKKDCKLFMFVPLLIIFVIATSFTSDVYSPYYRYSPIFMERSELEKSVFYQNSGTELQQPGKIYYKNPYIFVNEKYKGVHIIDNSNPSNPQNIGFIVAPGCIDMAVKGNIIYLDNAVDLVAFNLDTKQVTERIKEIFPEPNAPDNSIYWGIGRPQNMILVGWKKVSE